MTNPVIQMPTAPVDLSARAMLVDLRISAWSARKFDKTATREVAQAHNAAADVGRYTKRLIGPGSVLDRISKAHSAARARHYELTLPWMDSGARILSAPAYFPYSAEMRRAQTDVEALVLDFAHEYPNLVQEARTRLNGLYRADDYPADIRDKFAFGFNVLPMPTAADFRADLGTLEVNRIKSQMESDFAARIENSMKDVWVRMFEVVTKMSQSLRAYSVTPDGVQAPFRDSLVSNIKDVLRIVPLLNITNDAAINAAAVKIETDLTALTADQLRCSKYDREQIAAKAEAIALQMSDFI